jgi:hypothetical protein
MLTIGIERDIVARSFSGDVAMDNLAFPELEKTHVSTIGHEICGTCAYWGAGKV